jgi:hypothetical protein
MEMANRDTNGLAKHYEMLTPWERVPLMMAADMRGDEAEAFRLRNSAPCNAFDVPDYRGFSEGLRDLGHLHMLMQLELAAGYWHARALLLENPAVLEKDHEESWNQKLGKVLQLLAFRLLRNANGWELFCVDLNIDPEVLLRHLPGYEMVKDAQASAQAIAFTATEAEALLHSEKNGQAEEQLPEAVAEALREYLELRVTWWRAN